jgi:hypothetical protein
VRASVNIDWLSVLFAFTVFDLLFFPQLSYPFLIPLSIFFCLLAVCRFRFNLFNTLILLIFFICIAFSVFVGLSEQKLPGQHSDDFKRMFQFLSFFIYGAFAFNYRIDESRYYQLLYILRFSFIYFFVVGSLFFVDPDLTLTWIGRLYPESTLIHEANLDNFRFSYILTGPNGAAYFFIMCFAAYLHFEVADKWRYFVSFIVVLLVLMTQSRGGILSLSLLFGWFVFFDNRHLPKYFFLVFCVSFFGFVVLLVQSEIFLKLIYMLQARSELESQLGGGRLDKYLYWINNFNFFPWGVGYNLTIDGEVFSPHSDLIRLNLSYGIVVTLLFPCLIRPRVKAHFSLLIPFLIGFFINAMIDGHRSFGTFLVFYGLLYNLVIYKRAVSSSQCHQLKPKKSSMTF